jgi:hypothetical protein
MFLPMRSREKIIRNYLDAYNTFDIKKMLIDLDEAVKFVNISNGVTNMTLIGLNSFKEQAEQAKSLFSKRTQTIKSFTHQDDETEIEIDYNSILAVDLPNGLKKGDELNLQGKSIFKFSGNKIIELTDIS